MRIGEGQGGSARGILLRLRPLLIALTAVLLVRQLAWALFGRLSVDEFEEFQVIWLVEHGVFPYRDFFHTHLPVYDLLLYPLYLLAGPSIDLPGYARLAFFPIVLLTLFEIGWLARRASGHPLAGWLAVLLFLSSGRAARTLAEMRPDSIGLALALLGLCLVLDYLRGRRRPGLLCLAGAVVGLSLLFSQKTLPLILVTVIVLGRHHARVLRLPGWAGWLRTAVFVGLVFLPFAALILVLGCLGLLNEANLPLFVTSGLHLQITAPLVGYKWGLLAAFLPAALLVVGTGLAGAGLALFGRGRPVARGSDLAPALLAAYALIGVVQMLVQPIIFEHLLVLPFAILSILAAGLLVRLRPGAAVAATVAALSLGTALDRSQAGWRGAQMAEARFVQRAVSEAAPVLDSMSGDGTFRPILGKFIYYRPAMFHPDFYGPQNRLVRQALEERRFGAVIDSPMLAYAPEEIRELIRRNYEPAGEHRAVLLPRGNP